MVRIFQIQNLLNQAKKYNNTNFETQKLKIISTLEKHLKQNKKIAKEFYKTSKTPIQDSLWPLYKQILKLPSLKIDLFSDSVAKITEILPKLDQNDTIIITISNFLPLLKSPSFFLYNKEAPFENEKKILFRIAKSINHISNELENIYSLSIDSISKTTFQLCKPLKYISLFYFNFIDKIENNNKIQFLQPRAQFIGPGLPFFSLENQIARKILSIDEFGNHYKENILGTHSVWKSEGIFYKPNGIGRAYIGPEREFAIYAFYNILDCFGIAPTILAKIQNVIVLNNNKVDFNNVQSLNNQLNIPNTYERVLQAGLGIDGYLLQDIVGFLNLIPYFESCYENKSKEILNDIWNDELYNNFLNENQQLIINEKITDLNIETIAIPFINKFEEIFNKIKPNERCIEFITLPCTRNTKIDIYSNLLNNSNEPLIGTFAILNKYPKLSFSNNKSISFTTITDCFQFVKKLKKIFSNFTSLEVYNELLTLESKFDSYNFSCHVISSILTNPTDHKSDNLMIQVKQNEKTNKIEKLMIIGIDNDLALTTQENIVHSMIYHIEKPMNEIIHPKLVHLLINKGPEEIIFEWIVALEEQNKLYNRCKKQGIITHNDLFEHNEQSLSIPITLNKDLISQMYKKIKKITLLLQKDSKISLFSIFKHIQPNLADACIQTNKNYSFYEDKYKFVHSFLPFERINENEISNLPSDSALLFLTNIIELHQLPLHKQVLLVGKALRTFPQHGDRLRFFDELEDDKINEIFIIAVKEGYRELVARLLEYEKLLKFKTNNLITNHNNNNSLKLLSIRSSLYNNQTPLLIACDNLLVEMIELLLYYGASIEDFDKNKENCLSLCLSHFSKNSNQVSTIIKLLNGKKRKLLWNQAIGHDNSTALHYLILNSIHLSNEAEPLIQYFIENGASPDIINSNGFTPFDIAIQYNCHEIVSQLISLGAGRSLHIKNTIEYYKNNNSEVFIKDFHYLQQQSLLLRWNLALKSFKESNSNITSSNIILSTPQLGKIKLSNEIINELIENDNIKSGIQFGRRNVQKITINGYDFYFKQYPEMPGIEFAVDCLFELLIGHGTSCTEFGRLNIINKNKNFPVLISQGINGKNLHDILKNQNETKNFQDLLDRQSFSELFLASLLVNFEDAKPDNFIVEELPNLNENNNKKKFRLIGIDNDHAFVPPLTKSNQTGKGKTILVKCILYCIDLMKESIHPFAREKFLSFNPENFLKIWLHKIKIQSEKYNQLFSLKEHKEYSKPSKNLNHSGIIISIPFCNGMIANIFQKFQRLQIILRESPSIDCLEILRLVIPSLGIRYEEAFYSYSNPLDRFLSLTKTQYSIAIAGRLDTMINSRQLLKSMKISSKLINYDVKQSNFKTNDIENAILELNKITKEYQSTLETRKSIQKSLLNGKINEFNNLLLNIEKEKIINGDLSIKLNPFTFQSLDLSKQKQIIQSIIKNDYRKLILNSCYILDVKICKTISKKSPMLLHLEINDCIHFNQDQLITIFEMKYLTKLILTNLPELKLKENFQFLLPKLRELKIIKCQGFLSIQIPDNIQNLSIEDCWNLEEVSSIKLKQSSSSRFNVIRNSRKLEIYQNNNMIVCKLYLKACPKLKPWWNVFNSWFNKSKNNIIQLQNVPLQFSSINFDVVIKSLLNSSENHSNIPLQLLSLFNYFNMNFTECIDTISNWKPLSNHSNPLQIIEKCFINELPKLEQLNCSKWNRHINEQKILHFSKQLIQLKEIILNHCIKITDKSIKNLILNCKNLIKIEISNCYKITDKSIQSIVKQLNNQLIHLNISKCYLLTDNSLSYLIEMKKLEKINFSSLHFSEIEFLNFCKFIQSKNILELIINNCNFITNNFIDKITSEYKENFLSLKKLSLNNCNLINNDLSFNNMNQLNINYLSIKNNYNLSGTFLNYLNNMNLNYLNINGCISIQSKYFNKIPKVKILKYKKLSIPLTYTLNSEYKYFNSILNDEIILNSCEHLDFSELDQSDEEFINIKFNNNNNANINNLKITSYNITSKTLQLFLENNIFQSLKYINLSYCTNITNILSFINLKNIKTIIFDNCYQIQNFFPFYTLKKISLSNCYNLSNHELQYNDEIIRNLKYLSISHCYNISDIQFINYQNSIEFLDISNCKQITDDLLYRIFVFCLKLKELNISNCFKITGNQIKKEYFCSINKLNISNCFSFHEHCFFILLQFCCPNLQILNIDHCNQFINVFLKCKKKLFLKEISMSKCFSLTNEHIEQLTFYSNYLTKIDFSFCYLISDEGILSIAKYCNQLLSLNLSNCSKITDLSFIEIAKNCKLLSSLNITNCYFISDESIINFHLHNLIELYIKKCVLITDKGFNELNLKNIEILDISKCIQITNKSILNCLHSVINLKEIQLIDIPCDNLIFKKLNKISSLKSISINKFQNLNISKLNNYKNLFTKLLHYTFKNSHKLSYLPFKINSKSNLIPIFQFVDNKFLLNSNCFCRLCYLDFRKSTFLSDDLLIQFIHLNQLKYLNLSSCEKITQNGFLQFGKRNQFFSLEELYLDDCIGLTNESLDVMLDSCISLKVLSVSATKINSFSQLLKSNFLIKLNVLHCLNVSDSKIEKILTKYSLQSISLSGKEITDQSLQLLSQNSNYSLLECNLIACNITNNGLYSLSNNCTNLQKIIMRGCNEISDEGIKSIADNCPFITFLDIYNCPKISPDALHYLSSKVHLTTLKVSCDSLTSNPFSFENFIDLKQLAFDCPKTFPSICISNCKFLSDLTISFGITIEQLSNISKQCKLLQKISISSLPSEIETRNTKKGKIGVCELFKNCKLLKDVSFTNILLSTQIFNKIGKYGKNLTSLNCFDCVVYTDDKIPLNSLASCKNLLSLGFLKVTGIYDDDYINLLKDFTHLTSLTITSNDISEKTYDFLRFITDLEFLTLNCNQFIDKANLLKVKTIENYLDQEFFYYYVAFYGESFGYSNGKQYIYKVCNWDNFSLDFPYKRIQINADLGKLDPDEKYYQITSVSPKKKAFTWKGVYPTKLFEEDGQLYERDRYLILKTNIKFHPLITRIPCTERILVE